MNWFGRRGWSYLSSCTDYVMCKDTAERLCEPDYEIAAFTHGPELRQGARDAVRAFVRARVGR
ncbi:MAG TPA: hypothetical protein VMU09_12475 [Acidimicrobiales bacterium]|nr:hypothetical protein [Acidimicrobiales bacterium]